MAWYPFGTVHAEVGEGKQGPPGIGFKLSNDGNFDMQGKILKNCQNPTDSQDVSTKHFVLNEIEQKYQQLQDSFIQETTKRLQNLDTEVSGKISKLDTKYLQVRDVIDAAGRRIINSADPVEDQSVVTKSFFENNTLFLRDGQFDINGHRLTNLNFPQDKYDATNKRYVDTRTKINDKKTDNVLTRDNDGLYVPPGLLLKTDYYDVEKKRISNVSSPIISSDVTTKEYVDNRSFFATIDGYYDGRLSRRVKFTKFSSTLLDSDMKLTVDMHMKVTLYLPSETDNVITNALVRIAIGRFTYEKTVDTGELTFFAKGKSGDYFLIDIVINGLSNRLKPTLHIERISYI